MRAAIVGCGSIASVHAKSICKLPGNELAGFADIRPERARAFAEEYGGRAYSGLEELLEQERPEVLHICTPHYLHVPMAVYALEKGCHVFMEKPPAICQEQFEQLKRAASAAKGKLGVCFQNRYNPSVLEARRLLESGKAGRILGARGFVTWNRGSAYYTESGWRGRLETEGGGALINQSIHTLDLLTVLLGKPTWVEAGIANHHLKGIIEVEDTMEACIAYEDRDGRRIPAVFYATTAYCDDAPPLIEIACEKLTIRIEDLEVTLFYRDGRTRQLEIDKKEALGKSYWGSGHKDCIEDFYRCCRSGAHYAQELDGIQDTARLMLAAYESAREQKAVSLCAPSGGEVERRRAE